MSEKDNNGTQPFSTNEKILAFCLYMAGCEFLQVEPCLNLYDTENLFTIGGGLRDPRTKAILRPSRFAGMELWDAAQEAWKEKAEGHVEFQFLMTQECHDLVLAYRDQRNKMKASEAKGSEMAKEIIEAAMAGAMLPAEAILRFTCLAVKLRPEFLNLWKEVVPMLHKPLNGKSKTFETTGIAKGRTVPATGVTTPGYNRISLNAGPELRKKMGF